MLTLANIDCRQQNNPYSYISLINDLLIFLYYIVYLKIPSAVLQCLTQSK